MIIPKMDQKILDKYLNGKKIKQAFQTPLRNVRGYSTEDNYGLFISTKKQRSKLAALVALCAVQKGWNSSTHTEGSHLICILYP